MLNILKSKLLRYTVLYLIALIFHAMTILQYFKFGTHNKPSDQQDLPRMRLFKG